MRRPGPLQLDVWVPNGSNRKVSLDTTSLCLRPRSPFPCGLCFHPIHTLISDTNLLAHHGLLPYPMRLDVAGSHENHVPRMGLRKEYELGTETSASVFMENEYGLNKKEASVLERLD